MISVEIGIDMDALLAEIQATVGKFARVGDRMESLGKSVTKSITAPLLAMAGTAKAAAAAQRQAANNIRRQTGATGDDLKALTETYQQVREKTGAGATAASDAISAFHQHLGLNGDALAEAGAAAVRMAQATGTDVKATATSVARLMTSWGVDAKGSASTMQLLLGASRPVTGGVSALIASLSEAGPALRTAGIPLETAAGMVYSLAQAGIPTEEALGALQKAVSKFAKEGAPDIGQALFDCIRAIRNSSDKAEAYALAVDRFGKKGGLIADAIRKGSLVPDQMGKIKVPGYEPVPRLAVMFGKLQAQLEQALTPLGKQIAALLPTIIPPLQSIIAGVGKIIQAFTALPQWVQSVIIVVLAIAALAGPVLAFAGWVARLFAVGLQAALRVLGVAGMLRLVLGAGLIAIATGIAQKLGLIFQPIEKVVPATTGEVDDTASAIASVVRVMDPPHLDEAEQPELKRPHFEEPAAPRLPNEPERREFEVPKVPSMEFKLPQMSATDIAAAYAWQDSMAPTTHPPLFPNTPYPNDQSEPLSKWMMDQGKAVTVWWQQMADSGWLPSNIAPGSWLDINRPEVWFAKAQAEEAREANDAAVHQWDRWNWQVHQDIDKQNAATRDAFLAGFSTHLAGDMGVDLSAGASPIGSQLVPDYKPPTFVTDDDITRAVNGILDYVNGNPSASTADFAGFHSVTGGPTALPAWQPTYNTPFAVATPTENPFPVAIPAVTNG